MDLSNCSSIANLSPLLCLNKLNTLNLIGTIAPLPDHLRDSTNAQEILAWWRAEKYTAGRRQLLEVKLLIVGQGGVGKSHLRERLFAKDRLDFYEAGLQSTHSFDPVETTVAVAHPDAPAGREADVKVRAWDFGGQPELHSSHRFFLGSQRCFYLLVLAADRPANGDGPDSNRLNYWLRLIAHYGRSSEGKRAPVLIVVTRTDLAEANPVALRSALDDARRGDWFGANVVDVVEGLGWRYDPKALDLRTPAGQAVWERHEAAAARIQAAICRHSAAAPDLWEPIPEEYHLGREFVANAFARGLEGRPMAQAYLAGDALREFTELFRGRAGVVTDEQLIAFRNVCLGMLQQLGAVHWVGDLIRAAAENRWGVRDTAFNPEWVKWPVYDLLWMNRDECPRPGVVPKTFIERMLGPHRADARAADVYRRLPFGESDRELIVALMTLCRLAYHTARQLGLLIPDLLWSDLSRAA